MIHIEPTTIIALNYTCRYCKSCDLLVAHKHEIEHLLTTQLSIANPQLIGDPYVVMGTITRKAWKENVEQPKPPREMLDQISVFKSVYEEFRVTQAGWFRDGVEPPIVEPPPSQEWTK